MSAYWSRLSTKAVRYGAGVVDLFFKEAEAAKNDPNFLREEPKSFVANVVEVVQSVASAVGAAVNGAAAFVADKLGIGTGLTPATPVSALSVQTTLAVEGEPSALPPESAVSGNESVPASVDVGMEEGTGDEAARLTAIRHQLENIADLIDDLKLQVEARTSGRSSVAAVAGAVVTPQNSVLSNVGVRETSSVTSASGGGGSGGGGSGSSGGGGVGATAPSLIITEIMYNASGTDDNREWIEIKNNGTSAASLGDVKFLEGGTNHSLTFARGSAALPAGAYAVIADDANQFLIDYPTFSGTLFDSSFSLSNDGETLALTFGGSTFHSVAYASSTGARGDGDSLQLIGGVWAAALPTPGSANAARGNQTPQARFVLSPSAPRVGDVVRFDASSSTDSDGSIVSYGWDFGDGGNASSTAATTAHTYTAAGSYSLVLSVRDDEGAVATTSAAISVSAPGGAAHVVISEAQVAGVDDGDEFIELFNPIDTAVDLLGWSLQYVSASTTIFSSTTITWKQFSSTSTISAKGFYLVARRLDDSGVDGYRGSVPPDMTHRSISLSRDGGRIFLVAGGEYIGSETDPAIVDVLDYRSPVPASGESLERRAWKDGVCVGSRWSGEFAGNGCDTDTATDFEIRAAPNPQNTLSFPEPRAAPLTPAPLDVSSSIAAYSSSSLVVSFAWQPSADFSGATSTVRYELYDMSDVALSTLLAATTSTEYSYRVNEVGRNFTYTLNALDRDGLSSATTTIALAVPSFLDNLFFYRDPRAPGTSYRVDLYYNQYPFIPVRYSSGNTWRLPVIYLNRAPLEERDIHLGEPSTIPQAVSDGALSFTYFDCGRNARVSDFIVLPDTDERCAKVGPDSGDFSYDDLEDLHLSLTLVSSMNEIVFTPSVDYISVAFYDYSTNYWAARHRMFSLVAVDANRYHFSTSSPPFASPVMNASTTVDFDELNSRLIVRWDAATDLDTLDNTLAYEINFSPVPPGATASSTTLDGACWESAGPQPSAQIDDQTFVSYRFVRTVSPGDAFAMGVRAKDEFGNLSNIATTSWVHPPVVFSIMQESANGWSAEWGNKRIYYSSYPDVASLQSVSSTESIQFNRVVVRVRQNVNVGYGPATLRLSVYGDSGGEPDLNVLLGTALLSGVGALTGDEDTTFSFSPTISFTAGTRYWLMLDVAGYSSGQGYDFNRWQNAIWSGSDLYPGGRAGKGAAGVCPDPDYCRTTIPSPDDTADWYFKLGLRE